MLHLNRMADVFLILALNGMRSDRIINWLQQENYDHQEEIYIYTQIFNVLELYLFLFISACY